jgi:4-amino-4-deoxy-L-arabinose transferase-like glycosyltransferase
MGLGILTKGPLVAPFVIGPMLAMPWVVGRPIKGWWRGLLLTAVLAALPPVCWLAWLGMAHGYRTVGAIIWNQGAGRVVAAFDHARPWWWYGPWLVVLWLPWITWPQLWRLRWALWRDVGGRLCLAWMVPPVVLLSLASGKQPHYLLPLFPAIALVLGRLQEHHRASREDSLLGPGVAFLLIGFLPCLGWFLAPKLHSVMTLHQAGQWAMIFTLLGVILIWMGRRLTKEEKVMGLATSALLGLCLGQPVLVEVLAPRYDLRAFAVAIARLQAQGMTVVKAGAYHGQFDFLGHLPRPIAVLPRAEVCERADLLQATVVIAELPEQWRPKAEGCLLRQPYRGHQLALLSPAAACAAQRQLQ